MWSVWYISLSPNGDRYSACLQTLLDKWLYMNSAKLLKVTNWIYDLHWMANLLTVSLPEYLMEFFNVSLTFEYVDEIVWCDHSNESSLPILSHGAFFFFFSKWKIGNLVEILLLAKFGSDRVKVSRLGMAVWAEVTSLHEPLLFWFKGPCDNSFL